MTHLSVQYHLTVLTSRLQALSCSTLITYSYSQHREKIILPPPRKTSKDSLCSVHWAWCHLETQRHSHLLWSLHHTSLQTPPCSLEDRKGRRQYRNFNPQFSEYILKCTFWNVKPRSNSIATYMISQRSQSCFHSCLKYSLYIYIIHIYKYVCITYIWYKYIFKYLYSSPFTHSKEKCWFYSGPFVLFLQKLYQNSDDSFGGLNNLKLSATIVG